MRKTATNIVRCCGIALILYSLYVAFKDWVPGNKLLVGSFTDMARRLSHPFWYMLGAITSHHVADAIDRRTPSSALWPFVKS